MLLLMPTFVGMDICSVLFCTQTNKKTINYDRKMYALVKDSLGLNPGFKVSFGYRKSTIVQYTVHPHVLFNWPFSAL